MKFLNNKDEEEFSAEKKEKDEKSDLPPAVRSAVNIMDYADNTERKLREKLRRKSFSSEEIEEAVAYVKDIGYLDDDEYVLRAADYLATVKLYGRYRIVKNLAEKGFYRSSIDKVDFSEYDFFEICKSRAEKSRFRSLDQMRAALMRYGFTADEIRYAREELELFTDEDDF